MDIRTSQITLDYPLYVCDFDPSDASRLVVGGGGGASRTGVGNKITLLNTSRPEDPQVHQDAEIELAKDEDSVTSLAAGPRRGRTTLAFAGINASIDELQKGHNEHFHVFGIDGPALSAKSSRSRSNEPKITELARAQFFSATASSSSSTAQPDLDTYQRLVRLSAPFPDGKGSTLPQLGACATGLSKLPEIVVFDVTSATPAAAAQSAKAKASSAAAAVLPKVRGRIELPREAADLDVVQTGADQYQLAYCSDHQLYLFDVATKAGPGKHSSEEPYLAYELTADTGSGAVARPTFRAIRYVTPRFVLAVCNLPKRTGAFLLALRLPDIAAGAPTGDDKTDKARITVNVRLPKAVTQATGLAVRNLSPPTTPGARQADGTQFVVAVAGGGSGPAGNSLSLYTLEYKNLGPSIELLTKLYPFRTIPNVHELPMTSIALSHFQAPQSLSSSSTSTTPIQYLRLASVSVQNTVVVHAIPLRRLPPPTAPAGASPAAKAAAAAASKAGTGPPPQYVVALKSKPPTHTSLLVTIALLVLGAALFARAGLEITGFTRPVTGIRSVVPQSWLADLPPKWAPPPPPPPPHAAGAAATVGNSDRGRILEDIKEIHPDLGAVPNVVAAADTPVAAFLSNAMGNVPAAGGEDVPGQQVLFMRGADADHTIEVVTHDPAAHGPAVPWEDLDAHQKHTWRQRLLQAGHWAEGMGESVFKGILFSELGAQVGAAVG